MSTKSGRLIVFEGSDGAGKSTQILELFDTLCELKDYGFHSISTEREPGGTSLGLSLNPIIFGDLKLDPITELLLFAADRREHTIELKKTIAEGGLVLCDRFTASTIAYQGYGHGIPLGTIHQLNNLATDGLKADLTIWIDVEPSIALSRIKNPDNLDLKTKEFQSRVQQGYQDLERQDLNFIRIDGTRQPHEVAEEIKSLVFDYLRYWKD